MVHRRLFRGFFFRFDGMLVALLLVILVLPGCGGGGGGGNGGTGVDPVETEIGTLLDAFGNAVAREDLPGAMSWIDSNLQYFPAATQQPEGYAQFQVRLQAFLNGATVLGCEFPAGSRGILGGETSASFRGVMTYQYMDSQSVLQQATENVEMLFERVGKWSIISLSGFNKSGLAFPPAP